ncbi:MAG: cytochrome c [Calditrichia bacterium]
MKNKKSIITLAIELTFFIFIVSVWSLSPVPEGERLAEALQDTTSHAKQEDPADSSRRGGMMGGRRGMMQGRGMMGGGMMGGMMGQPVDTTQGKRWVAPTWTDTLTNPVAGNAAAAKAGKTVYANTCAICHGTAGEGNGPAGNNLNPRPANLTLSRVQNQSDGAIFWKITTGYGMMASYKEALSQKQRWEVVDYIRKLGKKE